MEKPTLTTVEGLRIALEELGLCTKGHKPELKQRFRKAIKKQKDATNKPTPKEEQVEEEKK
jgi:3'-5' exoribonuclease 1